MLASIALLLAVATPPPQAHACRDVVYHALDFWVGDWVVTSGGHIAGTNHVESALDGCAILEHYVGVRDFSGRSISMYDAAQKKWTQRYVTAGGRLSDYIGSVLPDGSVQMIATINGAQVRMTFTLLPDREVRQRFERSTDAGKTWSAPNDLIYTRRP
jgi:hypothetical protein